VYKCFISKNYDKAGEAHVIISRVRGNGKLSVAHFLIDLWCLGVKDAFGNVNMEKDNFEKYLKGIDILKETEYDFVHNLIYGAIEFAEEGDIEPVPAFDIWEGMLAEDNDDIPLIEMEFGKDGKHFLITEPGSPSSLLIPKLKSKLGENFSYMFIGNDIDSYDPTLPEETIPFHYDYPEYPEKLKLKNQFIADILLNPANEGYIPKEDLDKIINLPEDEVEEDLTQLILWEIGRTYRQINEDPDYYVNNYLLIISLLLLGYIGAENNFDTVMEVLHQSPEFLDAHLYVAMGEYLQAALLPSILANLDKAEKFINEQGHASDAYISLLETLTQAALANPGYYDRIVGMLTDWAEKMPERLVEGNWFTSEIPGFLTAALIDLNAQDALPYLKKIYETELVDEGICGDWNEVLSAIERQNKPIEPRIHSKEQLYKMLTEKPEE
ncbi:MAG: hypothetical protein K2K58_00915, partial [Muribaculaceae bacterium]|nr:hypothetical protein [Muribaculaceae bacterium]